MGSGRGERQRRPHGRSTASARRHLAALRLARPPSTATWNLFNHLQFQLLFYGYVSFDSGVNSQKRHHTRMCFITSIARAKYSLLHTSAGALACLLIIALGTAKVTGWLWVCAVLCHEWAEPNATNVHSKRSSAYVTPLRIIRLIKYTYCCWYLVAPAGHLSLSRYISVYNQTNTYPLRVSVST